MPAKGPAVAPVAAAQLRELGARLRGRRKQLGVNATTTAEAAGLSRVTLYRIELGEPSVAMGAYLAVVSALGLRLELAVAGEKPRPDRSALPKTIKLAAYPQLQRLAWQLKGRTTLSPEEALGLYERNWRHVDPPRLKARERALLEALLIAFGRERLLV